MMMTRRSQALHQEQEMSMEEILASIRRYVSDDETPERIQLMPEDEVRHEYNPNEHMKVRLEPDPRLERLEQKPEIKHDMRQDMRNENDTRRFGASRTDYPNDFRNSFEEKMVEQTDRIRYKNQEEQILKEEVVEASSQALLKLVQTKPKSQDDLLYELVLPLIRDWLNSNLPTIVERIVQREVEKITKGLK